MFVLQQKKLACGGEGKGGFRLVFFARFKLHQMFYRAHGARCSPHPGNPLIDGCDTLCTEYMIE